MKNYGSHFIVLRAMIDSGDHFGEPNKLIGFDLEAARAGIAHYRIENPSNVDTESHLKDLVDQANLAEEYLAEIERLRADLEQAEICIRARMECIDDQAAYIKELESSLDEAEALTKKNAELMNGYLGRIKVLEKNCIYDPGDGKIFVPDGHPEIERLRARVVALEDALVEERAGAIRCEFYDHCEIDLPDAMIRARQELQAEGKIGNSEHVTEPTKMIGFDLERARGLRDFLQDDCAEVGDVWGEMIAEIERLRAENAWLKSDREFQSEEQAARIKELENAHKRSGAKYAKIINELRSSVYANIPGLDVGKIGPDAKPRSWQITEERIGLLEYCLETLLDAPDIEEIPGPGHSIEMLRAMLREAEQCE
jgi:hypothetical protein